MFSAQLLSSSASVFVICLSCMSIKLCMYSCVRLIVCACMCVCLKIVSPYKMLHYKNTYYLPGSRRVIKVMGTALRSAGFDDEVAVTAVKVEYVSHSARGQFSQQTSSPIWRDGTGAELTAFPETSRPYFSLCCLCNLNLTSARKLLSQMSSYP